jgi:NADPH2 dehydrogenase
MEMPDPISTFAELVTRIRDSYPDFAYIHVIEATEIGTKVSVSSRPSVTVKCLRDIWGDRPYIANAHYERETAIEVVEKEGGLVSFGRYFISNVSVITHILKKRARALSTNWSVLTAGSPTPPERKH